MFGDMVATILVGAQFYRAIGGGARQRRRFRAVKLRSYKYISCLWSLFVLGSAEAEGELLGRMRELLGMEESAVSWQPLPFGRMAVLRRREPSHGGGAPHA